MTRPVVRRRRRGPRAGERLWLEGGVVDPNLCTHSYAEGLGELVLWCAKCGAVNFDGQGWTVPSWAIRLPKVVGAVALLLVLSCRGDYDAGDAGDASSSSSSSSTSTSIGEEGELEPDVPVDLGELEPDPYGPCGECPVCSPWSFNGDHVEACSSSCSSADQCPELEGGVPVCSSGRCYLSCAMGIPCPDGWRCVGLWCAPE